MLSPLLHSARLWRPFCCLPRCPARGGPLPARLPGPARSAVLTRSVASRSGTRSHLARDCLLFENSNIRFWRLIKLVCSVQLQLVSYLTLRLYTATEEGVMTRWRQRLANSYYQLLPAALVTVCGCQLLVAVFLSRRFVSLATVSAGGRHVTIFCSGVLNLLPRKYPINQLHYSKSANASWAYMRVDGLVVPYLFNVSSGSFNTDLFKSFFR